MRRTLLFLLSIAVAAEMGATAQAPDVLKIGGTTYSIHTNPLTKFLEANPGRLPKSQVFSTGLWRGYIATWSIRENRLYLDDVLVPTKAYMDEDAPESKQFRSGMKPLFGNRDPRVATWFTGHLIVPTGEMVNYVHMGYGSTYSSYLIVSIIQGEVMQRREMNTEQFAEFRRAQYEAFKKTPEYAKELAEAKRSGGSEPMSDELTEQFLFHYTSEMYLSRIFEVSPP